MSAPTEICGEKLSGLIETVRHEYWRRPLFDELEDGLRQANTSRVVICQMLERRSPAEQQAIVADVYRLDGLDLLVDPAEIFSTAATTGEILFDLICEVCWQALAADLSIRVEDEVRSTLTDC